VLQDLVGNDRLRPHFIFRRRNPFKIAKTFSKFATPRLRKDDFHPGTPCMNLHIQTTQNVLLEFLPASIGDRILAFLLDGVIIAAWLLGGSLVFGKLFSELDSSWQIAGFVLIVALPAMFYSLLSEVFMNGQSIGKKALGLRVVRLDGTPPRLGDYLMRWLLRMLDIWVMSGLVGLITMAMYNGQRLGDRAARTAVVKMRPPVQLEQLIAPVTETDNYHVTYPEAIVLSDRDINTIRKVLKKTQEYHTFELLELTAGKVRETTGIHTEADSWTFLQTLVRDHAHLALQED
jgi:uncharacterized RDD family membrane protein YckC